MEDVKKWIDETVSNSEQLQQMRKVIADTTEDALSATKSSIAVMEASTKEQVQEAKGYFTTVATQYKHFEGIFFAHLKAGVITAADNPTYTTLAGLTAAVFIFKAPRKFLASRTLGRFWNDEQRVVSAEQKVERLRGTMDLFKNETQKLQERALLAEEELVRGRTKLVAAGAEINRLWTRVCAAEQATKGLKDLLKELPARDSIRLRAEVANLGAEAKRQRSALDRRIASMTKLGVNI